MAALRKPSCIPLCISLLLGGCAAATPKTGAVPSAVTASARPEEAPPPAAHPDAEVASALAKLVKGLRACIKEVTPRCEELASARFGGLLGQVARSAFVGALRASLASTDTLEITGILANGQRTLVVARGVAAGVHDFLAWEVAIGADGVARISDLRNYSTGASLSGLLPEVSRFMAWRPSLADPSAFDQAKTAILHGERHSERLAACDALPPGARDYVFARLKCHLALAQASRQDAGLQARERQATIEWAQTTHELPNTTAARGFLLAGNYRRAEEELDAIEREIGSDPALVAMRADFALEARDLDRAAALAERALAGDRDLVAAHWVLFSTAVQRRRAPAATQELRVLRDRLGVEAVYYDQASAASLGEAYEEFIASEDYRAFEAEGVAEQNADAD